MAELSASQLAEKAGVSIPTVYGIEAGRIANPRLFTQRSLARAIGKDTPAEITEELKEQASIEGVGELEEFDPYDEDNIPTTAGIYVFYDVSNRPVYVGQASDIKRRLREHRDKFWFRPPIVETAAFVGVADQDTRDKIEKL